MDSLVGVAGLTFLTVGVALAVVSYFKKRAVAGILRRRFPDRWNELGQPRPSLLTTSDVVLNRFIFRREYLQLGDPHFADACDRVRRFYIAFMVYLLGGFVALGAAILVLRLGA
ncbi:MAG: hypothetical protein JSV86_05335 [Gemmatimonadota bacterium]|nr:MAG: hypothetical protein JSV86_05335 [Gemmatimonadota bacterium]